MHAEIGSEVEWTFKDGAWDTRVGGFVVSVRRRVGIAPEIVMHDWEVHSVGDTPKAVAKCVTAHDVDLDAAKAMALAAAQTLEARRRG